MLILWCIIIWAIRLLHIFCWHERNCSAFIFVQPRCLQSTVILSSTEASSCGEKNNNIEALEEFFVKRTLCTLFRLWINLITIIAFTIRPSRLRKKKKNLLWTSMSCICQFCLKLDSIVHFDLWTKELTMVHWKKWIILQFNVKLLVGFALDSNQYYVKDFSIRSERLVMFPYFLFFYFLEFFTQAVSTVTTKIMTK